MKDYKKIYSDFYGIKWDRKKFEIHHIDRDRNNNNIQNLVLLPKSLHQQYHHILEIIKYDFESLNDVFNMSSNDIFHADSYINFFEIKNKMMIFWLIRNDLKLILHNYKYSDFEEVLQNCFKDLYEQYK